MMRDAENSLRLAQELVAHLGDREMGADELIRSFRADNPQVGAQQAEMGLAVLLNRRLASLGHDMLLRAA